MEKNPWVITGSRAVYSNPWISLTEFDVINPGGGRGIYGKIHFKNTAIGIIPVDEQGNTYLVGQYRFTLDAYSWEIPEGGGLVGTDKLEAAQRELREETGLIAASWEAILNLHLSNSVSDEEGIVYLATGLAQVESDPEETEQLAVRKLPFVEACRMAETGEITDCMSVAGLLRARSILESRGLI